MSNILHDCANRLNDFIWPIYKSLPHDEDGPDGLLETPSAECQQSWLWNLAPYFIAKPLGRTNRSLPKPNSTSYVNGLRGIACIAVLNQHYSVKVARWIQSPYGTENNFHFWQLPYLRLIHCGFFMVAVFFVLSGFVLAYSPLRKMTQPSSPARDAALLGSLSSSFFRRPLRLFMPMLAAIGITALIAWTYPGFDTGNWRKDDPSFLQHLWTMVEITLPALNPYSWAYYWPRGFTHGWTLQMEYRGSVVIFLLCLLTCKLTSFCRKVVLIACAWWSMVWARWEIFCFIEGMIIAEFRLSPIQMPSFLSTNVLPFSDSEKFSTYHSLPARLLRNLPTIGWSVVLAFALLVGGWPTHDSWKVNPYKTLYYTMPAMWQSEGKSEPDPAQCYWISIGAGLLLLSMEHLPRVQAFFNTKVLVYLGEISYSFYLMHETIIYAIGSLTFVAMRDYGFSFSVCFYFVWTMSLVLLLWVADMFWRGVDEKCVQKSRAFAQWVGL